MVKTAHLQPDADKPRGWRGPCALPLILATLWPALAAADMWLEPLPLRRAAMTEGRDFDLNAEAFSQRFSYRHLSAFPKPGNDGLRGTGGSLTGDDLYHETTGQLHLNSDSGIHALLFRMKRAEDFDGRFDRQLIGYRYNVSEHLGFTIAGDAAGDKSRSDVQFEAHWQPDKRKQLRAALVLPEFLFNDKQTGGGRYQREARTLFLHYQHEGDNWTGQFALNASPEARFSRTDAVGSLDVAARQLRAAAELTSSGSRWDTRLRAEYERTRRRFQGTVPASAHLTRRFGTLSVEARDTNHPLRPGLGLRLMTFAESGWFGTGSDAAGNTDRTETTAFAAIRWQTTDNSWWEPAIHITHVDVRHAFTQGPWRDRDQREWQAKLLLPWRVTLDADAGAVLTLHASIRLHEFGFGGGNIQIHWPL